MSVTRYRASKDLTKKQQMEAYIRTADKYINGARAVARRSIKNVKILRVVVGVMVSVCIAETVFLWWKL